MSEGGMTSATAADAATSSPTSSSTFESFASKFVKSCEAGKPLEVTLDGKKLNQPFPDSDVKYISELQNLQKLSMNACKVKSFAPLVLPSTVTEIEMADNVISDLEFLKTAESSLESLNIGNNPISSIEALHLLSSFPKLEKLDIEGTPVMTTKQEEVEKWCWDNLKNLKVLNKKDKDGKEVIDEDEEEEFDEDEDDDEDDDEEDDEDDDDEDDDEAEGEDGDVKKVDLKKFYEGGEEIEDDDEDDFQPDEGAEDAEGKKRKAEDGEEAKKDAKAPRTEES